MYLEWIIISLGFFFNDKNLFLLIDLDQKSKINEHLIRWLKIDVCIKSLWKKDWKCSKIKLD